MTQPTTNPPTTPTAAPAPTPTHPLTWPARILLILASLAASYLLFKSISFALDGSMSGCIGGGDCDKVLTSPWSYVWKIPVSAPALLVYILLLVLSFAPIQKRAASVATLATAVLASAIWFTYLQAFRLDKFCLWCCSAHLAGSLAAILLILRAFKFTDIRDYFTGLCLVAVLVGLQHYMPYTPEASWAANGPQVVQSTPSATNPAAPPTLSLYDGRIKINLRETPILGSPDAPRVALVLYDPTCPHCHELHNLLSAARSRLGKDFAIALLPAPLDAKCNQYITNPKMADTGSCALAELTLAVYIADPSKFEEFLNFAYNNPIARNPALARAQAVSFVTEPALNKALADPRTQSLLNTGIQLFGANRAFKKSGKMPQMHLGPLLMLGEPSEQDLNQKLDDFMK